MRFAASGTESEIMDEFRGGLGQGNLLLIGQNELPAGQFFPDVQAEQILALAVQEEVRDKGNAEADAGQIQQQVVAAQFDLRHQIQLVLLKQLMQLFAGGSFSIQHQDRVILQVFQ